MAFAISARWTAFDGSEDRANEVIREMTPLVRAETGCRFYQANRDPKDPRVFFIYEIFDDEAALQVHIDSEHVRRLAFPSGELSTLIRTHESHRYETMDA